MGPRFYAATGYHVCNDMKAVMKLSRETQGTNAMGREKNGEERGN